MLEQLREIVSRLTMPKIPPIETLQASLDAARDELEAAESKHAIERDAYTLAIAAVPHDLLASSRQRKKLAVAAEAVQVARDRVEATGLLLERATAQVADAEQARRVQESRRSGELVVMLAEDIDADVKALAVKIQEIIEQADRFRVDLLTRPAVSSADFIITIARRVQLQLYAQTGGKIRADGVAMSAFELAQGPNLKAQAKQQIDYILSLQPKVTTAVATLEDAS